MSYTLTPYLVDLGELRRAVGKRDEALLAAIREGASEYFADEETDEETDEEAISLGEALRHLVMGDPPKPENRRPLREEAAEGPALLAAGPPPLSCYATWTPDGRRRSRAAGRIRRLAP